MRKDNIADLPLDIETQSHELSQHKKTTKAAEAQLQTVISNHERSGAINQYCERSSDIASEPLNGEATVIFPDHDHHHQVQAVDVHLDQPLVTGSAHRDLLDPEYLAFLKSFLQQKTILHYSP